MEVSQGLPRRLASPGEASIAARRARHHCITISMDANGDTTNKDSAQSSHMNLAHDGLSQLSVNIPSETAHRGAQSTLQVVVLEPKCRSQSVSTLSSTASSTESTEVITREKPRLGMQRSLSLHEFCEDALPIDICSPPTPLPLTPKIKSPKSTYFMTRRSSNIEKGQVFTVDDFEMGKTIGRGFFGKAVKVTLKVSGEQMVIKELISCDEEGKKTFLKEAAVLRGLSHPKLLRYIGFLYKGKDLHIVTEYIPGGTLEALLRKPKSLQFLQKLSITIDIASAMEYLHSQKVIHRDLNSPNCLLREDGGVAVADFGLSKLVLDTNRMADEIKANNKSPHSPRTHKSKRKRYTVVGNPYWMAPEMLRGQQYDENVDIFSFGIIMCEVIGQVKADPDYLPRLSNFALDEATFIEQFCNSCPEAFYQQAFQCCKINPDERPPFQKINKTLIELYRNHTVAERKASRLLVNKTLNTS